MEQESYDIVIRKTGNHEAEPMCWVANATAASPFWASKRTETDHFMPDMVACQADANTLKERITNLGSEEEDYGVHVASAQTLRHLVPKFRPSYFEATLGILQSKAGKASSTCLPEGAVTDGLTYEVLKQLEEMMSTHMVLDPSVAQFAYAYAKAQRLKQQKGAQNTKQRLVQLLDEYSKDP